MGACTASGRVGILHKNVKGMIGQITTALAEADINAVSYTHLSLTLRKQRIQLNNAHL